MGKHLLGSVAALWVAMVVAGATQVPQQAGAPKSGSLAAPADVVKQYCLGCHSQRVKAGGLVLETVDLSRPAAHAEVLEKVVLKLRGGLMPPAGSPRPPDDARNALVSYLETSLDAAATATPNPGRPALHRLNRAEYANAIRDLLALDIDPAVLLPPDDSSDGFDNNADVLGVSPALLERYLSAAREDQRAGASAIRRRLRPPRCIARRRTCRRTSTRGAAARHARRPGGHAHVSQSMANTSSRSSCSRPRSARFAVSSTATARGVARRRAHPPCRGGRRPEDYVGSADNATDVLNNIGARLTVRVTVTAGPHAVGAAFLGRSAVQGGRGCSCFGAPT